MKQFPTIKLNAFQNSFGRLTEWHTARHKYAWACHWFFECHFHIPETVTTLWVTAYTRPGKNRVAVQVELDPDAYSEARNAWAGYYLWTDKGRDKFYLAFGPNWMKKVVGKTIYVGVEYA